MTRSTTAQEALWSGDFGRDYARRNRGEDLVASDEALFRRVLRHTTQVTSVLGGAGATGA